MMDVTPSKPSRLGKSLSAFTLGIPMPMFRRSKSAPNDSSSAAGSVTGPESESRTESECSSTFGSDSTRSIVAAASNGSGSLRSHHNSPARPWSTGKGVSMGIGSYQVKFVMQKTRKQKQSRNQAVFPFQLERDTSNGDLSDSNHSNGSGANDPSSPGTPGISDSADDSSPRPPRSEGSSSSVSSSSRSSKANSKQSSRGNDGKERDSAGLPMSHLIIALSATWLVSRALLRKDIHYGLDWIGLLYDDVDQMKDLLCHFCLWLAIMCTSSAAIMAVGVNIKDQGRWIERVYHVMSLCALAVAAYYGCQVIGDWNANQWEKYLFQLGCARQTVIMCMRLHSVYSELRNVSATVGQQSQPQSELLGTRHGQGKNDSLSSGFCCFVRFCASPALVFNKHHDHWQDNTSKSSRSSKSNSKLSDGVFTDRNPLNMWVWWLFGLVAMGTSIAAFRMLWPNLKELSAASAEGLSVYIVLEFSLHNLLVIPFFVLTEKCI
jgi:hypothetical protein